MPHLPRAERKAQILALLGAHSRDHGAQAMSAGRIAKALGLADSSHLRTLLMEMVVADETLIAIETVHWNGVTRWVYSVRTTCLIQLPLPDSGE